MAFRKKGTIKELEGSGFGKYDEANGGGQPVGGKFRGKNGRVGWSKRVEDEGVRADGRESQARTADGKYTYNSVNGKDTKYKSRGTTVNPLLTGGVNGIQIKDAKKQFAEQKGEIWDKYKDKWYERGSKKITKDGRKLSTVVARADMIDIASRRFDIKTGMFEGEAENWETKVGARSMAEKEARKEAFKKGEETYVKGDEGAIEKLLRESDATYEKEFSDKLAEAERRKKSSDTASSRWISKEAKGETSGIHSRPLTVDTLRAIAAARLKYSAPAKPTTPVIPTAPKAPEAPKAAPIKTAEPTAPIKTAEPTAPVTPAEPEKEYSFKKGGKEQESATPRFELAGKKYTASRAHEAIERLREVAPEKWRKVDFMKMLKDTSPEGVDKLVDTIEAEIRRIKGAE